MIQRRKPLKRSTQPLKRSPLRRVSKKRHRESRIYSALRAAQLIANPACEVCHCAIYLDLHHLKGRGKFYLDPTTFLTVCRSCHEKIHANPSWARANGYLQT